MIGKRVIRMKRPAVLCAAAFVTGILSAGFMEQVSIVRERAAVEGFIEDVRHVQQNQEAAEQHSYAYCPYCGKELPK